MSSVVESGSEESETPVVEIDMGESDPSDSHVSCKIRWGLWTHKVKRKLTYYGLAIQLSWPHFQPYVAEFLGTLFLVLLCIGSLSSLVLIGALKGIWELAVVCGTALGLAIYGTAYVSGAHLNPAISLTMAIWQYRTGFTFKKALLYWVAQLLGSIAAGFLNYALFNALIAEYEQLNNIHRGQSGSELSAMIFVNYFPNPGYYPQYYTPTTNASSASINGPLLTLLSPANALFCEAFGSGMLSFMAFALTDPDNRAMPRKELAPYFIGLTLTCLIAVIGPITMASFNPARDLGPRFVAAALGWGTVAFPGSRIGFWVYILGPFIGAPIGGGIYLLLLGKRPRSTRSRRLTHSARERQVHYDDE
ncbi:aquaporin-like protein [Polychytrium aggregatum]|uniref:aquaporin-like protein n=1 Tax=Polychytrium aggregatum TaxID=110093 RepID=UPI0022FDC52E|nr:aquaporin-like protein [Polychytrium aggregatum]KAI9204754.1 aquaporin-like protein [Polychytrium aggregatum]